VGVRPTRRFAPAGSNRSSRTFAEEGGSAQALIFNVILLLDRAGKNHGLGDGDCRKQDL
jgi:hypothetical protein